MTRLFVNETSCAINLKKYGETIVCFTTKTLDTIFNFVRCAAHLSLSKQQWSNFSRIEKYEYLAKNFFLTHQQELWFYIIQYIFPRSNAADLVVNAIKNDLKPMLLPNRNRYGDKDELSTEVLRRMLHAMTSRTFSQCGVQIHPFWPKFTYFPSQISNEQIKHICQEIMQKQTTHTSLGYIYYNGYHFNACAILFQKNSDDDIVNVYPIYYDSQTTQDLFISDSKKKTLKAAIKIVENDIKGLVLDRLIIPKSFSIKIHPLTLHLPNHQRDETSCGMWCLAFLRLVQRHQPTKTLQTLCKKVEQLEQGEITKYRKHVYDDTIWDDQFIKFIKSANGKKLTLLKEKMRARSEKAGKGITTLSSSSKKNRN